MRLNVSKRVHYDSGPNMTPLVDVVMVILIFLMLVGQFGAAEHFLVSNLPMQEKGLGHSKLAPGFIPDEPLEIRVDSRGPESFEATAGRIRTSDARQLTAQLTKMREQFEKAGTKIDRVQVVISPSRTVKYDYLIKVYEAALDAKFKKVAFARSHQ